MTCPRACKSPIAVMILSIITLGIYDLFWIAKSTSFLSDLRRDRAQSPYVEVFLCIFTLGIYKIFWFYQYSRALYAAEYQRDEDSAADYSLMCAALCVILPSLAIAVLQYRINTFLKAS